MTRKELVDMFMDALNNCDVSTCSDGAFGLVSYAGDLNCQILYYSIGEEEIRLFPNFKNNSVEFHDRIRNEPGKFPYFYDYVFDVRTIENSKLLEMLCDFKEYSVDLSKSKSFVGYGTFSDHYSQIRMEPVIAQFFKKFKPEFDKIIIKFPYSKGFSWHKDIQKWVPIYQGSNKVFL